MSDIANRHVRGRYAVGKDQGLIASDHPLINPSDDIRHLFAEAYISVYDLATVALESPQSIMYDALPIALPLRIGWLSGFGDLPAVGTRPFYFNPIHDKDILIYDANDNIVINTTDEEIHPLVLESRTIDNRMTLLTWHKSGGEYDSSPRFLIYLIYHHAWNNELIPTPRDYSSCFSPASAVLSPQTYGIEPPRVALAAGRRIILNDTFETNSITNQLQINFFAGDNMAIAMENTEVGPFKLLQTKLTFTPTPGAGTTLYAGCGFDDPMPLYTINGKPPDDKGTFIITGDDCFRFAKKPDYSLLSGEPYIAVRQECKPCCDCQDYATTAVNMADTASTYKRVGQRLESSRNALAVAVQRWRDRLTCVQKTPLTILAVPRLCPGIEVKFSITNHTQECIQPDSLTLDLRWQRFTADGANYRIVDGTAVRMDAFGTVFDPGRFRDSNDPWLCPFPTGPWSPGETIQGRFLLINSSCGTYDNGGGQEPDTVAITVAVLKDGLPLIIDGQPVTSSQEVTLNCPLDLLDFTTVAPDCD